MKILIDISMQHINDINDNTSNPVNVPFDEVLDTIKDSISKEDKEFAEILITDWSSYEVGADYPGALTMPIIWMNIQIGEVILFNSQGINYKQG